MAEELENENTLSNVLYKIEEENQCAIYRKLSNTYLGYFNTLINHSNGNIYFTKETNNFMTGTLIKEIEFCVNQMFREFGKDIYARGHLIDNELEKEKDWNGRTWIINNLVIDLKFSDKLYIILSLVEQVNQAEEINEA